MKDLPPMSVAIAADRRQPPSIVTHADALPADIRAALSADQRDRLENILSDRRTLHAVDYRASTSFFGRRFYVSFFVGPEERSLRRIRSEGHGRSFHRLAAEIAGFCLMVSLLICLIVGAAVITLYVAKSFLGIDLMEGHSFLHEYFFWR